MNSLERIERSIRLHIADRVPVAPFVMFFAARHAGITMEDYLFDKEKSEMAAEKTFKDFGGWDAWYRYPYIDGRTVYYYPVRFRMPGRELAPNEIYQTVEQETMKEDDYNLLISKGFRELFQVLRKRVWPEVDDTKRSTVMKEYKQTRSEFIRKWNEINIPTLHAFTVNSPFDELSLYRSMLKFYSDLYRFPEKVNEALDILTIELAETIKKNALESGAKGVFIGCYRLCGEFFPPKQFEKFGWPHLLRLVNILTEAGALITLHCDSNWTLNLPYFKELPKGKCILALDNHTDIFKAKQILKNHVCILGDVPAPLLTIGSKLEVEDYCKRLIDVVGDGGGFILGSGDELPVDTKPENFRVMLETVKNYGIYR